MQRSIAKRSKSACGNNIENLGEVYCTWLGVGKHVYICMNHPDSKFPAKRPLKCA